MATIRKTARSTLTAVEMDHGDVLEFTLSNGETRRVTLLDTAAQITDTNLDKLRVQVCGGRTNFQFTATVDIDGQRHELWRECSTQRSFYEPWQIAGMTIYFDAVDAIFEFLTDDHGGCRPRTHARLAVQDATLPICPALLHPWCPMPPGGLNINECYNGEDCWLGAYWGAAAHGGLDINHPAGTPIFAPMDIDDHEMFNTTYARDGNNRWRGWHRWPDGSTWIIQVHHVIGLYGCKENQPISAGRQVARGAGVGVGDHEHSHFVFGVVEPGRTFDDRILLDPWILFRQMYIDQHGRR